MQPTCVYLYARVFVCVLVNEKCTQKINLPNCQKFLQLQQQELKQMLPVTCASSCEETKKKRKKLGKSRKKAEAKK